MKKLIFVLIFLLSSYKTHLYSQTGWYQQSSGVNDFLISIYFVNSNTGWICGDNGRILKTTNGGENWLTQVSNINFALRSIYFLNENTGWAAGGKFDLTFICSKIILKTTNGGNTWLQNFNTPDFYNTLNNIYFSDFNTGYATGFGGTGSGTTGVFLKTTNAGNSWVEYGSSESYSSIYFTDQTNGWLLSNYGDDTGHDTAFLIKTINSGDNWTRIISKDKNTFKKIQFISFNTGYILARDQLNGFNRNLILKSTDGGINWIDIYPDIQFSLDAMYFIDEDTGWVAGGKIYKTINGGSNWSLQLDNGLQFINAINFVNTLTGWAVGEGGLILKTITGGLTSIGYSNENIPNDFSLSQNYPNPFNPTTNINFSIPKSSFVTLKVYDMLGKEVASLVNENLNPGSYYFDFNAANLTSGIYFYKLTTLNFTDIKKMTLLK
ncbi:MAG: YCF48-related protein [bacterium]